jgi:radical SAM superfamily enzyme YgiQ (UPF0313 family)
MSEVVLATLNARFIHCAFGLRYLAANMGELRDRTSILEFEISSRPGDIAERLLEENPRIIGLGIYIWNASFSLEVSRILKSVAPEVKLVVGGPEVSHEWECQPITELADHVITGEADVAFAALCRSLLEGIGEPKIIHAGRAEVATLASPYPLYSEQDLQHRVLYVEASRGCPFSCEFCLSSLENGVRPFPLEPFLQELRGLLDRGARRFKFVDRTFNLSIPTASAILDFFLTNLCEDLFLHFELVPDRLPEALREKIAAFPAGVLQFEVGIQTFNPDVAAAIHRRQNFSRLEENLLYLRNSTGVYIHADLIAGLPGESLESFGNGFDRLIALGPQEIQVGILKRLRGTPIVRHDAEWEMVYSTSPPYELLQNRLLDFSTMQRISRFSRYWDLVGNSGNFSQTKSLIWSGPWNSPFFAFLQFSDWLHERSGRRSGISLVALMELIFEFLTKENGIHPTKAAESILADYHGTGHPDVPPFLRDFAPVTTRLMKQKSKKSNLQKRQSRDLARS